MTVNPLGRPYRADAAPSPQQYADGWNAAAYEADPGAHDLA